MADSSKRTTGTTSTTSGSGSPPKRLPCPVCGGRKVVSFGTTDAPCGNCDEKGTVKA